MNELELLQLFLDGAPDSFHPADVKRFMDYAIKCVQNGNNMDIEKMREYCLPDDLIDKLETAFLWIRRTYVYLNDGVNV